MEEIIKTKDLLSYVMGTEELYALKGVSMTIHKNEYVAIMGPSGSGKSTMMNIIGCLDTPTSGYYELNGQNVSEMDDNDLATVRNKLDLFSRLLTFSRSNALHNV